MENESQVPASALGGKPSKASPKATHAEAPSEENFTVNAASLRDFALVIADAMKESRKPYVSEEQKQNDETMRLQMKKQAEQSRRQTAASQAVCPHIQGCNDLSEAMSPTNALCIVWHKLDTNCWVGLCTNCLRQFWPTDPDYAQWRQKKSGNRASASGYREFADPAAAMAAR